MIYHDNVQLWLAVSTAAILSISACAASHSGAVQTAEPTGSAIVAPVAQPDADGPGEPEPEVPGKGEAIIHTTEGAITITFFPDIAPKTVAHIVDLMKAGCYQGVDVFRLEPNFVAQVAPVSNRECHPDAMSRIPAEFSKVIHARLYLSMARWDEPDSATSSFSIMLGSAPSMDGQYTVFGRVVDGEDTLRKIEAISTTKGDDGMSRPDRKVSITRVEVVDPT